MHLSLANKMVNCTLKTWTYYFNKTCKCYSGCLLYPFKKNLTLALPMKKVKLVRNYIQLALRSSMAIKYKDTNDFFCITLTVENQLYKLVGEDEEKLNFWCSCICLIIKAVQLQSSPTEHPWFSFLKSCWHNSLSACVCLCVCTRVCFSSALHFCICVSAWLSFYPDIPTSEKRSLGRHLVEFTPSERRGWKELA